MASRRGKKFRKDKDIIQNETFDGPNNHSNPSHVFFGKVTPEMLKYMDSIEQILTENQFESDQEQRLFQGNVFSEIQGQEMTLMTHFDCSRILERLIKICSDDLLFKFYHRIKDRFVDLVFQRYSSHVCQTLLIKLANSTGTSNDEAKDEGSHMSCESILLNICDSLNSLWLDLMFDPYASHIMRTILLILSPKAIKSDLIRSKRSSSYVRHHQTDDGFALSEKRTIPSSFLPKLKQIFQSFEKSLNPRIVEELCFNRTANPVTQLIITIQSELSHETTNSISNQFLMKLSEGADAANRIGFLIRDAIGSHMIEKIIQFSSSAQYQQIYSDFFRSNLGVYSSHPVANFVIQRLISYVKTPAQLKLIISELNEIADALPSNVTFQHHLVY